MNIIDSAGGSGFDALLYQYQNPLNRTYIENQFNNIPDYLSEAGRLFIDKAKTVYDKIYSSEALRSARNVIAAAKGFLNPNIITHLSTIEAIQTASPVMQRWVMTCPELRELYMDQRCVGYSDTYKDREPTYLGEKHYDYRKVMDGIIVMDEKGWYCNEYLDVLEEGDTVLEFEEQVSIIKTWDLVRMFMNEGKDPTAPSGGYL